MTLMLGIKPSLPRVIPHVIPLWLDEAYVAIRVLDSACENVIFEDDFCF